jgi:CHAT domain-containing protein
MPKASLLHLAMHAKVDGNAPWRSCLQLADERELSVEEILEQARGCPPGMPGGEVVLPACTSDLTLTVHDEAVTLSTGFLAGGAVSVVAARWPIPERASSLLMVAYHHHLARGLPPRDALRAAQLWLLSDRPQPFPGMGPALSAVLRSDAPFSDVYSWAAFTHQGR